MSVSQILLIAGWMAGGDYISNLKRFFQNKPAVVFSSFYFLHLIGLLYTSDFNAGLNDLKIKLPLVVLPFIVSSMPLLSEKKITALLTTFITSVFVNTIVLSINNHWLLISPIRFSMMACFSIFIIIHLLLSQKYFLKKVILPGILLWLIFFLVRWPYETGIVTFIGAVFFTFTYAAYRTRSKPMKFMLIFLLVALPVVISFFIYSGVKRFYGDTSKNVPLEKTTAVGEAYQNDLSRQDIENGNYTWRYIARNELEQTWNKRSKVAFNGNDGSGQPLSVTLIRFLTSKGLRKDANGVEQLTPDEVHDIENGIANIRYTDGMSLDDRLYETIWSIYHYRIGNNPQGSSVTQRFEFWKAGWRAFLQAPLIGRGTGSVKLALNEQYEKLNTALDNKHRLKTHSQYLATSVALGIIGFLWLLTSMLFPFLVQRNWTNYLGCVLLIIVMLAMLVEDTLETQAGVTFVSFFYSLLIFGERKISDSSQ